MIAWPMFKVISDKKNFEFESIFDALETSTMISNNMRMIQNGSTAAPNGYANMDEFITMLRNTGHREESEIMVDFKQHDDPKYREKLLKKQEVQEERLRREKQRYEAELKRQEQKFDKELERFQKEAEKKYDEMEKYYQSKPMNHIKIPKNLEQAVNKAKQEHKIDDTNFYNFGFAGHSKMGKSSLINAIRGLRSTDSSGAEVDITECTTVIKFYIYPNGIFPNIRLYDIPGSGTLLHSFDNYYQDKALCAFDCLVILVQDTLGEEEVFLARTAKAHKQNAVFVRSRCDLDFNKKNESTDMVTPTQSDVKKHVKELRDAFKKQIDQKSDDLLDIKIFFVSANSLRALVNCNANELKEQNFLLFEEQQFLDYLMEMSKKSRGSY